MTLSPIVLIEKLATWAANGGFVRRFIAALVIIVTGLSLLASATAALIMTFIMIWKLVGGWTLVIIPVVALSVYIASHKDSFGSPSQKKIS